MHVVTIKNILFLDITNCAKYREVKLCLVAHALQLVTTMGRSGKNFWGASLIRNAYRCQV